MTNKNPSRNKTINQIHDLCNNLAHNYHNIFIIGGYTSLLQINMATFIVAIFINNYNAAVEYTAGTEQVQTGSFVPVPVIPPS